MSNNHNYQSRQIVKTWFNRAKSGNESYNYFDRFIALWVSFNCFFVAEFYGGAKTNSRRTEPQERDYLKVIIGKENYAKKFSSCVVKNQEFKETLTQFKDLVGGNNYITHFKGKIADMRPNRLEERYAQEFTDINNFEQFIFSVYQIRCNLFHGNKSPENDADVRLVETLFKAFLIFSEEIYHLEGYLYE